MLSHLSRVARSLTTTVRTPNTVIRPAIAYFSTNELVLGKGRGKTSTGLHNVKEELVNLNKQLLKEIVHFAPDNPYRINLTIVAKYHLELISVAPSEKQLIRTLANHEAYGEDILLEDLIQRAKKELQALRDRAAAGKR